MDQKAGSRSQFRNPNRRIFLEVVLIKQEVFQPCAYLQSTPLLLLMLSISHCDFVLTLDRRFFKKTIELRNVGAWLSCLWRIACTLIVEGDMFNCDFVLTLDIWRTLRYSLHLSLALSLKIWAIQISPKSKNQCIIYPHINSFPTMYRT